MKVIKRDGYENVFPYIAYVPENISSHPALLVQLHGAGERGNGGEDTEKVLIHGFAKIVNDTNLNDCILVMPQCPKDTFWVAKIESIKVHYRTSGKVQIQYVITAPNGFKNHKNEEDLFAKKEDVKSKLKGVK